jgi:CMP-N-acetylneuraminic acid synthetase
MASDAFARSPGERWLAIVPMKRHSERVPGKNTRRLAGEPLFFWILQTLSQVDAIGRIVVDTDGEEIAAAGSPTVSRGCVDAPRSTPR